jgi:hypothetical protein
MSGGGSFRRRWKRPLQVAALGLMLTPALGLQPSLAVGQATATWLWMALVGIGMALAAWVS